MNEYEQQAQDFLNKTGAAIEWKLNGVSDRFNSGRKTLEYTFTLKRGNREHSGLFNSSIKDLEDLLEFERRKINPNSKLARQIVKDFENQLNSKRDKISFHNEGVYVMLDKSKIPTPSNYDLLACLNINYCEDLDDFISDYGYEINSASDFRRVESIYEAVCKESDALKMLFNDDEIEELQEIA